MSQHALLSVGSKAWRSLLCPRSELRLDLTLGCGQTFRWRETGPDHWTGVMGGRVWTLTQTDHALWYYVYSRHGMKAEPSPTGQGLEGGANRSVKTEEAGLDVKEEELLRDYFQLDVGLQDLYRDWSHRDRHFALVADVFSGVRMIRQDPVECLFSFICSSNNHVSRIQAMVEKLCHTLGARLTTLDQTHYHDFPTLHKLADSSVEACLRLLGFGYRARFVQQSARLILDSHGPDWLMQLRRRPYPEVRGALRALPGVGLKVADCVCLMSLDKAGAVPVDTHIWQIARRDYSFGAGSVRKSLTDRLYQEIGDFFRQLWGPNAGWAQSVLFCADLKKFQHLKMAGRDGGDEAGGEEEGKSRKRRRVAAAGRKRDDAVKEEGE
ncbi:N-glycosylase/DNA lyase [Denticeps clupeoides]|uniref:N-glycosylase/DNA lyase n=1 Tax=Denticeps clupeoides TaxID=299321 RepID=A0AAY4DBU0_9TELE|nr:N-glycosylase/DNA lyase [Denticeps clupeoides]